MNEQEWQKMTHNPRPFRGTITFKTVFPDDTPSMAEWNAKIEANYEGWKKAMNVSVAYSRFDSVKEYLKRKLFKIKGAVELEDTRERMTW